MNRADAMRAIDDAFADGLKKMFAVLVDGLIEGETSKAIKAFTGGLSFHDEAHAKASAAIEQIFPE